MAKTSKTAVYLRVSTTDQNLEGQRNACIQWLEGQGLDPDHVQWFEDKKSGSNLDRPAFADMQAAIFNGKVRTVVCYALDRLSRDQRDATNLLGDWCDAGVRVVVTTLQLDIANGIGKVVANLMFGLAELDRARLLERQAGGIAVAKAKGKYKGRKPGTTKCSPAKARKLIEKGMSQRQAAKALAVRGLSLCLADIDIRLGVSSHEPGINQRPRAGPLNCRVNECFVRIRKVGDPTKLHQIDRRARKMPRE